MVFVAEDERKEFSLADVDPPLRALCTFRACHHWLHHDAAISARWHPEAGPFQARHQWLGSQAERREQSGEALVMQEVLLSTLGALLAADGLCLRGEAVGAKWRWRGRKAQSARTAGSPST
jgi:hypothetical protein